MSSASRHILAVFLKFPEPGKVKTRHVADRGLERAVAIYQDLVAETLRHLPWERIEAWLCFDPPDKEAEVEKWLAPFIPKNAAVEFVSQADGGLGESLRDVMDRAFARPDTALFWDIPWSTERTLSASLAAAERAGRKVHVPERCCGTLTPWRISCSGRSACGRLCVGSSLPDGEAARYPHGNRALMLKTGFGLDAVGHRL